MARPDRYRLATPIRAFGWRKTMNDSPIPGPADGPAGERFADFQAAALAEGFDEVLERRWAPNQVLDTHTHPFAVRALVVAGEMWLGCGEETRHLVAGDRFEIGFEQPHTERYGSDGAVFWAARRRAVAGG
jgi:hypothetical protein